MMNALSLAVAVDSAASIEDALAAWERRERPLTEFTQKCSAEVARARINAKGRIWSDTSLRPARFIPTGTEHLPRLLD
jgi:2-polyprenyl-6-methoxyphenol hydroxylase-like FAD-dependent oxidoreductase